MRDADRMQEKIEGQERKALAAAELQEEFQGDKLAKEFEVLEYKGTSDQQLLALKERMGLLGAGGKPSAAKALGKGGETIHDAELVEGDDAPGGTHG